ncbi:MAG: putative metalloprotease with PDZ domain [Rhodoferax sp.]|jgi:predicted metalloprotease with PDZ domain
MVNQALTYRVQVHDLHAHLFQVTLTVAQPAALQRVSLPVWIPGSYLIREFAKSLQGLQAHQGDGKLALTQLDKCSWQINCAPGQPLVLRYEVYAFDNSVRTAWLDADRGFFNGTSLFLQVEGQADLPHTLELMADQAPAGWQVATGLTPQKTTKAGFGSYLAANYDELVDCPVEMGTFWSGSFVAGGVHHRFIVAGAPPSFDGARLLADTQAICETEINFWHGHQNTGRASNPPPHHNYLFMLNAVHDGYGGLEHRNSTALICTRQDLPRLDNAALTHRPAGSPAKPTEGYVTLLGLISHEYFHTWNVKRLRPNEFARYDYAQENYTQLLWFFEGFTSYYDDLLLHHAGLIDDASYLRLLNKTINQVLQTPGRAQQSVAQSSFDAWVKYYRQDENTPNTTVSYYTKGALVALCLDLTLRNEGKTTLDAVMRALWLRCQGGPMTQDDLLAVLSALSGRSFAKEITRWVHGTADLPLKPLLTAHGLAVLEEPAQLAQRLGLRVAESAGSLHLKVVLRGSAAEQAGFAAGDEWLGLEVGSGKRASQWRLSKLDDLLLYAGTATRVVALVARDKRLIKLPLTLPKRVTTWRLKVQDSQRLGQWLKAADPS